jgi:hypothetical protein
LALQKVCDALLLAGKYTLLEGEAEKQAKYCLQRSSSIDGGARAFEDLNQPEVPHIR